MRNQIKRFVHSFCIGMVPTAFAAYGGVLGIAAAAASTNETASTFLDSQIAMLVAMTGAENFAAWVIGLSLSWLAAFIWSMQVREPYATIESKLPPVSATINVVEDGDTIAATGITGLRGLYIGNIIAAAGHLKAKHYLEFAIVGYNGSAETIQISEVTGRIRAGTGNLRDYVKLPAPLFQGVLNAESGKEFVFQMRQDVSAEQAEEYLGALEDSKAIGLDLRELNIMAASVSNPGKRARFPLWDGVNLRRRDDVVSNRNTIMSIGVAAETNVSLNMRVTRADGTTEDYNA